MVTIIVKSSVLDARQDSEYNFALFLNSLVEITIQSSGNIWYILTPSLRRFLSYRNQSIDLLCKSMNWFLYDRDLRHERINSYVCHQL